MRAGRRGLIVGVPQQGASSALAYGDAGDAAPAFDPNAYPGLTVDMDPRSIAPGDLDGSSLLVWTSAVETPIAEYAPSALVHAPAYHAAGLVLAGHPSVEFSRTMLTGLTGPILGDLVDPDASCVYAVIAPLLISALTGAQYEIDGVWGDTSGYLTVGVADVAGALVASQNVWNAGDHAVHAPGLVLGAARVISTTRAASTQGAAVNDAAPTTGASALIAYSGAPTYVGLGYGEVHPLQGEIYRLLVYQGTHTEDDRAAIVAALQAGYL